MPQPTASAISVPTLWPPTHRAEVSRERVLELATAMITTRALDQAAVRWQRQGLLPAFPPALGQEAAQVGSASAIQERDFAFITYRDHGAVVALGSDIHDYMVSHLGQWNGGLGDPRVTRHSPLQAVVGATALHAVGWAHGARLDGTDAAAVAYIGDGASSQGDVHEAMNFAGVLHAPVVFFVQNNQWSLSTPIAKQVAGLQVAPRAAGYGMPSIQVNGDDVVAVLQATEIALEHARLHGPVLVEAFTYRRGPHATSDDPSRYRTLEEERLAGADPLDVVRALVDDDAWMGAETERAEAAIEAVRVRLAARGPIPGDWMFDHVFQEKTPQLVRQQQQWREESDHV